MSDGASISDQILALAEEYCSLVDNAKGLETSSFLPKIASSLSRLYSVAIELPYVELETSVITESSMSNEARTLAWKTLRQKLVSIESYYAVFDPTVLGKPLQGSIANDLAEIYHDLRNNIALAQSGAHPSDIAWSWRASFAEHWGNHATDALKAIYWRIYR
jgi:Domain of unknown function (DUF5063)